jgi:hypothetical protein
MFSRKFAVASGPPPYPHPGAGAGPSYKRQAGPRNPPNARAGASRPRARDFLQAELRREDGR